MKSKSNKFKLSGGSNRIKGKQVSQRQGGNESKSRGKSMKVKGEELRSRGRLILDEGKMSLSQKERV